MYLLERTADYIKLQYSENDYPLVMTYFDESRYGDCYSQQHMMWHEVLDDTNVVGLVCIPSYTNYILPNSVHVSVLEIDIKHRGKGYGTKVMQHIIDTAKQLSFIKVVTLQTREKSARAFYKKLGFKLSKDCSNVPFMRLYI